MKKDNYNFCDIQTDGHGSSMTDPAWRAEAMKIGTDFLEVKSMEVKNKTICYSVNAKKKSLALWHSSYPGKLV